MNFTSFSQRYFKIGFDFHLRVFKVVEFPQGKITLVNVYNRNVIVDRVDISDITIDGNSFTTVNDLQDLAFNRSCLCSDIGDIPTPFKYFDLSFDNSFE